MHRRDEIFELCAISWKSSENLCLRDLSSFAEHDMTKTIPQWPQVFIRDAVRLVSPPGERHDARTAPPSWM